MKGIVVEYKGFYAFARFYPEDGYYHGSIENIHAHATFGGETPEETVQDFHELVDEYLKTEALEEANPDQKKLIIDMSDYPVHSYQPVSLSFAEGQ